MSDSSIDFTTFTWRSVLRSLLCPSASSNVLAMGAPRPQGQVASSAPALRQSASSLASTSSSGRGEVLTHSLLSLRGIAAPGSINLDELLNERLAVQFRRGNAREHLSLWHSTRPFHRLDMCACLVKNTSAVLPWLELTADRAARMFAPRAFVHQYARCVPPGCCSWTLTCLGGEDLAWMKRICRLPLRVTSRY
jgi:hypothetical protein